MGPGGMIPEHTLFGVRAKFWTASESCDTERWLLAGVCGNYGWTLVRRAISGDEGETGHVPP